MHDRERKDSGPAARASVTCPRYCTHNAPGLTAVNERRLASSAPECGSNPGWRLNDNVCYYYNDTVGVDFHAALRHCRDEKALLASIHSQDEQAYVNSMVGPLSCLLTRRRAYQLTVQPLIQVGTGKVASAWIGMIMAGVANGQYK